MTKLTVVGAGAVGATTAYAALLRGLASTVALYDLDPARVRAEALDLQHGLQFVPPATVLGSAEIEVVAESDLVIITAGAKQRPGQSRLDLASSSVRIIRELMPKLVEYAPRATYLIVSNPVDVMTYAALETSGLPRHQVFGSGTVLDSARLRTLVAQHVGMAPQHVHAYIVGEHGDSEFPLWSNAAIAGVGLESWTGPGGTPGLNAEVRDTIADQVVHAAYEVIAGKGATNYAIGLASVEIAAAVLRDERRVLPVTTLLDGDAGLSDVCVSLPCVIDRSGVSRPIPTPMSPAEIERLHASADAVRAAARGVGL